VCHYTCTDLGVTADQVVSADGNGPPDPSAGPILNPPPDFDRLRIAKAPTMRQTPDCGL